MPGKSRKMKGGVWPFDSNQNPNQNSWSLSNLFGSNNNQYQNQNPNSGMFSRLNPFNYGQQPYGQQPYGQQPYGQQVIRPRESFIDAQPYVGQQYATMGGKDKKKSTGGGKSRKNKSRKNKSRKNK